jgi:methyl-accepting chemotaxis protein
MRLNHISVGTRLAAMAAIGGLALTAVATVGALATRESAHAATEVIDRELALVQSLGDLRSSAGDLRRYEKDILLGIADPKAVESYQAKWVKAAGDLEGDAARMTPLLDPQGRKHLTDLLAGVKTYRAGLEAMLARLRAGEFNNAQAANKALEPAKAGVRELEDHAQQLITGSNERVQARRAALEATARQQMVAAGITVALAALALTLAAWRIGRSILQPLQRVSRSLERVAQGDLGETIEVQGRDELAGLQQRLLETQHALRQLVGVIQENATSVAAASAQISQGNADLSTRTEQQASSLQQTAASMEELTGTVRQSAETARQADQLAQGASHSATRGGEVVAQVVTTMGQIQEASRRIGDIIGVIDGIAFQTNILALNAAVEAARAGEQGRGFAVVASEVRTLAQRSAEAARQIKVLIGDSTAKVEAGGQLVVDAGRGMDTVVADVKRVCDLISEISAAAGEQSQGIHQVGQAVALLDQTTQQNAALVEESAAAAESLKTQAARLADAAASFRLEAAPA